MRILFGGLLLIVCVARQPECQTATAPRSDTTASDTAYVEYHDSPITLPLPFGFRTPAYDRVDGLTLPWGPRLELGDNKLTVDGVIAYRSHLGDIDPSIDIRLHPSTTNEITLFAARGTFSNDEWIRSNLPNTLASFGVGSDARNYYRADRAEVKINPTARMGTFAVTPMLGARFENDWATGTPPRSCFPSACTVTPVSIPWSVFGRTDSLKMRRPNPAAAKGHISSALAGVGFAVDQAAIQLKIGATVEHAFEAPAACCIGVSGSSPTSFTQTTLSADVSFPTFGEQRFTARGHAMLGSAGLLPPQRYGYLGGAGTLATVNLLQIGGGRLLFAQGDYYAPIRTINLPYLGSPYVDLQYAAGNAGVGYLPLLIQNVGIGVGISYLRAGYTVDPARNRSPYSRKSDFSIGISLTK